VPRPDFPKTFPQFVRRFPDDQSCWDYLVQSRWPEGFHCPDGHPGSFIKTRKLFQCTDGKQWSVTSGTVMHRSKLPLHVWFWAAYLVTTNTPGMSAKQFAKQLDLHYETAYMLLQKLRAGMVNPERGKIGGLGKTVEMDEAFITGGRKAEGHKGILQPILAAVEVRPDDKAGRVRIRIAPSNRTQDLVRFLRANVEMETTVITDGNIAYKRITSFGYFHVVEEEDVDYRLPHIHRVFSNLKTWILGTHHGGIMHKHLQAYLNEFVFRFNRRKTPMAAFQSVLGIGTHVAGPTYQGIYEGSWAHPNPVG
jgi:transposase-like protein